MIKFFKKKFGKKKIFFDINSAENFKFLQKQTKRDLIRLAMRQQVQIEALKKGEK